MPSTPTSAKLLKRGYKVAICEQVEDPQKAQGVVKREVIKVLTPGTAVEVDLEGAKESIYIAGLFWSEGGWGLAVIDLASGRMRVTQGTAGRGQGAWTTNFSGGSPKEIIFPEGEETKFASVRSAQRLELGRSGARSRPGRSISPRPGGLLLEHFRVTSLAGFGLEDKRLAVGRRRRACSII